MSGSKQSLKADHSPERGNSPWIRKFSLRRSLKHRTKSSESLASKEVGFNFILCVVMTYEQCTPIVYCYVVDLFTQVLIIYSIHVILRDSIE